MYGLLLSNHDEKCLTCARNQDCEFQALGRELGVEESGIDWMTDNCINVFAGSMRNHTKALTRDEVKQIYLEAF